MYELRLCGYSEITSMIGDIREEEQVAGFVKNVLAKFGAVDVLVNNGTF